MATFTGAAGVVKLSTNVVGEVIGFTLELTRGTIEDTALTDAAKSFLPEDQYTWTATVECQWDDGDTSGQEALQSALLAGTTVEAHLLPEGTTTGDEDYNGSAYVTSISLPVARNAIITRTIQLQGTGALTAGAAA